MSGKIFGNCVTAIVDAADEWTTPWVRMNGDKACITVVGNGTGEITVQRRRIDPSTGQASGTVIEQTLSGTLGAYNIDDYGLCEIRVGCKPGATVTGAYEISVDARQ